MGWAATCFHRAHELSSLGLGSSSSLPLCGLLHACQAGEHSLHSRIERHSLVPEVAVRVEEGSEHLMNQVLASSLSASPWKINPTQARSVKPSLGLLINLKIDMSSEFHLSTGPKAEPAPLL